MVSTLSDSPAVSNCGSSVSLSDVSTGRLLMCPQTAVQLSHFALPVGGGPGASVVSLITVSVHFSGYITELPCQ